MRIRFWMLVVTAVAGLKAEEPVVPERDNALWEAGIIGADLHSPDYPAAGQKHQRWIAAPYVIYRGRILRADREGARARLLHGRRVDLEMSFAASFATRSKDNEARAGMPDLDYLVEAGPRLSALLSRLGGRGTVRFFLPMRAVFSTDLASVKHRGFTYGPALYAQVEPLWRPGWIGLTQLAGRFGDRQVNAYFYDIAPEFARPDRPTYDARAGYLGSDLFTGVVIPIARRWRLLTGGQLYFNQGSANQTSPLFKRNQDYSVGVGLIYTLYYSKALAKS